MSVNNKSKKCKVKGCTKFIHSKGCCTNHYYSLSKYGDPLAPRKTRSDKGNHITKSIEYDAWCRMRSRCYHTHNTSYPNYGGRGIKVCERWLDTSSKNAGFNNFISDMGARPGREYSLDRIDVNGDYNPQNCRWADIETQANNRRNNVYIEANGMRLTQSQWARHLGVPVDRIKYWRVRRGLSDQAIINKASSMV